MMDRLFAAISILGLATFMGIVMWFVREPDLIIVSVIGIGIGVYYFWQEIRAGGSHLEGEPPGDGPDG